VNAKVLWAGLVAVTGLWGCATAKPGLCAAETPPKVQANADTTDWFKLLLHGYDGTSQYFDRQVVDCTGTPVLWGPQGKSCEEVARGEPLPAAALTSNDLVLGDVAAKEGSPKLQLAWAIIRRFTDGQGLGPVALVETTERGRVVRAMGTLRAYTGRAQLRLEQAGKAQLLVAEGEYCPKGEGKACERAARVVPLRDTRFIAEPVTDGQGACLGPALFYLARSETVKLKTGWNRRFELNTAVSFNSSGIVAHEQMVVNDMDPKQPSTPPRLFRRAEEDRAIQVLPDKLVADTAPLWSRFASAR
jgi:hypothetical protein